MSTSRDRPDAPPPHAAAPRRRRAPTTCDADLALFAATARWRSVLRHREARFMAADDADAEIAAVVWELIRTGVSEHRALYIAASRRLNMLRRRDIRARQLPGRVRAVTPAGHAVAQPFERLDERLHATAVIAQMGIPERARPWVERRFGGQPHELTAGQYKAGRRWFNAVRSQVAHGAA